jgi:hypothetical protein
MIFSASTGKNSVVEFFYGTSAFNVLQPYKECSAAGAPAALTLQQNQYREQVGQHQRELIGVRDIEP